jgi:two-component system response regulator AtoC
VSKVQNHARSLETRQQVLVVDDAEAIRVYLRNLLSRRGFEVVLAEGGQQAIDLLEQGTSPEVIILDVMMPEMDGLTTLRKIKALRPEIPVIMLSVVGRASSIVDAMNAGASDYLNKPFEEEELDLAIRKVLENRSLREEREELRERLEEQQARQQSGFLWASEKMVQIKEVLEQVADADVTVLIHGESGVGKEIIARTLHDLSDRRRKPFVKVNCAALPEELLESELFGYERGAFTGASARKPGKFEITNRGTMFLDEIGEMSPALQAKLLQVLQDGEFSPLGGSKDVRVDVRVVVATNRNLQEMVSQGSFREDLYYRLNVVNLWIPPLRERREEILVLVEHFLRIYSEKYSRPCPAISERLRKAFLDYAWPGNVRELENMIKRVVVLGSEEAILEETRAAARQPLPEPQPRVEPRESVGLEEENDDLLEGPISLREIGRNAARDAEREALQRVLSQTNWNRKKAAEILEVSYKTLLQKIKECGLADT